MSRARSSLPCVAGLVAGLASGPSLRAQAPEPAKAQLLPPVGVEVVRIDVVLRTSAPEPVAVGGANSRLSLT